MANVENVNVIRDCNITYFDEKDVNYVSKINFTSINDFKKSLMHIDVLNGLDILSEDNMISDDDINTYMNKLLLGCKVVAPKHFDASIEVI